MKTLIEKSEKWGAIATALAKAQAEFPDIEMDMEASIQTRTGGRYGYEYASLAAIRKAVTPALAKNGIALVQAAENVATDPSSGDPEDGPSHRVAVQTELLHGESEQFFRHPVLEVEVPDEIKEIGIATSYFRRYQILALLGLAPEKDVDTGEGTAQKSQRRAAPPRKDDLDQRPPAGPDEIAAKEVRDLIAAKQFQKALAAITSFPASPGKEQLLAEYRDAKTAHTKENRS